MASGRATSPRLGLWFSRIRSNKRRESGYSKGSRTGAVSGRQELSTPGAPFGVHGPDVFDPDIEEAADPVGIPRRIQGDRGLVVGWASANIDDDPAVGKRDIGQASGTGEGHSAAGYLGVEAPGTLDIIRDYEVC